MTRNLSRTVLLTVGLIVVLVLLGVIPLAKIVSYGLYRLQSSTCPSVPSQLRSKSIVFASILRDAEQVFPYWRTSTLDVARCSLEGGIQNVSISIWSNGNSDSTSEELDQLSNELRQLHTAGQYGDRLRWKIETSGDLPVSISQADRITKLAYLRNLAIEGQVAAWLQESDALVYVNDVIFTPADVFQLLEHWAGTPDIKESKAQPMIVCALDFAYTFYDVWVSRDLNGDHLSAVFPYINGPQEERERALAGEPFQVATCWNGLLVMDAQIYVKNKLEFRVGRVPIAEGLDPAVTSEECLPSSESLLICLDYWRTPEAVHKGGRSIVIDPAVKVFYSEHYYAIAALVHPIADRMLWLSAKLADLFIPVQPSESAVKRRDLLVDMTCTEMPNWKLRHLVATACWFAVSFVLVFFSRRRFLRHPMRYSLIKHKVDDV